MDEENELIKNISKKKKSPNKNVEIKEIRLEKMSPGFNLVSLKARHRLNELKKIFSRSEYKDYIRKCKNMYSISSIMNNKYSIADLYLREKYDINDIVSVFNKIDSKLESQKIKVTRIKKDKVKNIIKEKSKTSINFFKNNSNFQIFKSNSNILLRPHGNNEENSSLFLNNNNNKMNYTSYDAKNNFSNFNCNDTTINNQMSKTTYNNRNKKSNILNYKTNYSLRNVKNNFLSDINKNNKEFSNTAYPTLFSKYKENKIIINNNKKDNNSKIKLSKLNRSNSDFSSIFNMEAKQYPLSCKNNCFNITKFGAIIYNHSMFRNKNIVNFVPKNYNLPLMYKNIKI